MPFRVGTNRIGRLVVGSSGPSWTPADFTNIQYWWTADAGVTDDGSGNVETWTDQINSYDLQQVTTANMPSITTQANLNGQNVVRFNGSTDWLNSATTPASTGPGDLTMLSVYYIPTSSPGDGVIFGYSAVGAIQGRVYLDGLSGNLRLWEAFATPGSGTGYTIESPMTTGAKAWKYRYDASAGDAFYAYNTLTETASITGGTTNQDRSTSTVVAMGALINGVSNQTVFGGRYIEMDMAESVVIYGTPTSGEMDEWETYVNNKYGTIIS